MEGPLGNERSAGLLATLILFVPSPVKETFDLFLFNLWDSRVFVSASDKDFGSIALIPPLCPIRFSSPSDPTSTERRFVNCRLNSALTADDKRFARPRSQMRETLVLTLWLRHTLLRTDRTIRQGLCYDVHGEFLGRDAFLWKHISIIKKLYFTTLKQYYLFPWTWPSINI